jgi:hypothetical protein
MVLTGAGLFGFGFLVGTILWLLLLLVQKRRLVVWLYAPFLPFLIGGVAALPYTFVDRMTCDLPVIINVFVGYSLVHCNHFMIGFLGNLYLVILVCGVMYIAIIFYYISLVRRVRQNGW